MLINKTHRIFAVDDTSHFFSFHNRKSIKTIVFFVSTKVRSQLVLLNPKKWQHFEPSSYPKQLSNQKQGGGKAQITAEVNILKKSENFLDVWNAAHLNFYDKKEKTVVEKLPFNLFTEVEVHLEYFCL